MDQQYSLPQDVWKRWEQPKYDVIRQAVIVFGGNTRSEAHIHSFEKTSLLFQEGECTQEIRGVLYVTTKRLVFLPENTIPHIHLIQITFDSLKTVRGTKNDHIITLIDTNNSVATLKLHSSKTLFQSFALIRKIGEASRQNDITYRKTIYEIATSSTLPETPFSSLEFDLAEMNENKTLEIAAPTSLSNNNNDNENDSTNDPLIELATAIKNILEYCNHLHFDIHIKLRILFFLAIISFILKFIPVVPLSALIVIIVQLYYAWLIILKQKQSHDNPKEDEAEAKSIEAYKKTQDFIKKWIMWSDKESSLKLMKICFAIFFGWFILSPKIYFTCILFSYCYFLLIPIIKSDLITNILTGFWFST